MTRGRHPSARWCVALPVLALLLVAGMSACAPSAGDGDGSGGVARSVATRTEVDVNTPELRRMKRRAGIETCHPGSGHSPVPGGLPSVTLPCLGGGPSVNLAHLRGPLVINVWASWCAPCREEMPVIGEFYERYGDRVSVLGIDYSDPRVKAAMKLAVESGVTYPLLADPGQKISGAGTFPRIRGLPFLVLVNERGVVVHQEYTVIDDVSELTALVHEHLGIDL